MQRLGEFFSLPFIYLRSLLFSRAEEKRIREYRKLYPSFREVDSELEDLYKGENPFLISKEFLLRSGKACLHSYGETPLSSWHDFLSKINLRPEDRFFDLGAGRGRVALFTAALFGCETTAIERIPIFCKRGNEAAERAFLPCTFLCEDMLLSDVYSASYLYFYALWHEEESFLAMIEKLSTLPPSAKIITVSFPLSDFSDRFTTILSSPCRFPWGNTEFFLNAPNHIGEKGRA